MGEVAACKFQPVILILEPIPLLGQFNHPAREAVQSQTRVIFLFSNGII
jgi:hypothetical protein